MAKKFKGTTHFGLVWDESGSMAGLESDALGNIEEQLKAAQAGENVKFSLWFFGTQYPGNTRLVLDAVDPADAGTAHMSYRPSGGTPLFDAVGKAVRHLEDQVGKKDRALLIVFTDGLENSSAEWDKDKIGNLIKDKEESGNWTVVFASAGISEWQGQQLSAAMHISAGSSFSSPLAGAAGVQAVTATTGSSTLNYVMSASPSTVNFYDPQNVQSKPKEDDKKNKNKDKESE